MEELLDRRRRSGLDRLDEVLIVASSPEGDPQKRSVDWLGLLDGEYRPIERSGLIELSAGDLAQALDWPSTA